jgi:hypothetical protein
MDRNSLLGDLMTSSRGKVPSQRSSYRVGHGKKRRRRRRRKKIRWQSWTCLSPNTEMFTTLTAMPPLIWKKRRRMKCTLM